MLKWVSFINCMNGINTFLHKGKVNQEENKIMWDWREIKDKIDQISKKQPRKTRLYSTWIELKRKNWILFCVFAVQALIPLLLGKLIKRNWGNLNILREIGKVGKKVESISIITKKKILFYFQISTSGIDVK